ncbi:MAG TPA: thioredoxin-dependent thiol peroxidase [Spirochaetia bacterium]|nr:thioredoxin-dependent thiol peroxidase [Spirochaetia bacterium]
MVKEGDTIKNFTLSDESGKKVSLADFTGKKKVIYFYPKDDTPGCTKEACSFRDTYDDILAKGAVVLGISMDSSQSHRDFKAKYNLPFHLLADEGKAVINQFGAWGEKQSFGKTTEGILRSTFIVDESDKVIKAFPQVKPEDHAQEILKYL